MEDDYTNGLIEMDSISSYEPNKVSYETTVELMQNFTNTVIELSQKITENNEAKYKAQTEIMIADIQAKMQEELQDINGYYNTREKQEEHFHTIITSYQKQFKKLTNKLISEENEKKSENIKYVIETLERTVGEQLNQLANNIASEQNIRLKTLKSRNRGLFGFFRKG